MKKYLKEVINIFILVLLLPFFVIFSPIIWYRFAYQYNKRLYCFLTFGRELIGGYSGKLKVGTNKNNVIYENDNFDIFGRIGKWVDDDGGGKNITNLLKMKVYNYWIEDDYLFVKVFRDDELIDKFIKDNAND